MRDADAVAECDGHHELVEDGGGVPLGEAVAGGEAVVEVATVAEVGDEVEVVVVVVDVVEAEDVGAGREEAEDLRLDVEAAAVSGVGEGALVD